MNPTRRNKDEKDNKTPTAPSSGSSRPFDVASTLRRVPRLSSTPRGTTNTGPSGGCAAPPNTSVGFSVIGGEGTESKNTTLDSAHFQMAGARTAASAVFSLTPRTQHPEAKRQPWSPPKKVESPPRDAIQSDQPRHDALGDLSPRLHGTKLGRSSSGVASGSLSERCASGNSPPGGNLTPRGSPPRPPSSGSPLSRSPCGKITFRHHSPSSSSPSSKESPAKKAARFSSDPSVGDLLDREADPKRRLSILEKELNLLLSHVAEDRGLFSKEIAELREAIAEEKRIIKENKEGEARADKRMVDRALSNSLL